MLNLHFELGRKDAGPSSNMLKILPLNCINMRRLIKGDGDIPRGY